VPYRRANARGGFDWYRVEGAMILRAFVVRITPSPAEGGIPPLFATACEAAKEGSFSATKVVSKKGIAKFNFYDTRG